MTVNRTTLLDLPLPVTGTESGTWGDTTNNGLTQYVDIAIAGTLVLSTDADVTLTSTEGDSSATNIGATTAQYAILRWTATGSTTRNITALAQSKTYVVINATGGTQSIVLRGAGPTTGVTIIAGEKAHCVWNGSDFVKVSSSAAAGGSNTQVQYNNAGVLGGIANATSDGTTLSMTSPKVITGINDTNGNELLKVTATGSAVNELTLANAATGNAPTLSATGDDTNIGINITPKGSGVVTISNLAVTTIDATNIEVTNIKAKDGTAAASIADSTGVISVTANPILSGGTANGVLYLDGSKVATSGSALTFDGTRLAIGNTTGTAGIPLTLNVASGNNTNLAFQENQADKWYLRNITGDGGFSFFNVVAGSEGMRLTSTGLGIGTSSPQNKFVVSNAGAAGFEVDPAAISGATYSLFINRSTSAWIDDIRRASTYQWRDSAGNEKMRIDSSGNVGIGTSSPASLLDVHSSGNTTLTISGSSGGGGDVSQIDFLRIGSGVTSTVKAIRDGANNSGALTFYTATLGTNTERMRLDSSGNLGLGVTPSAWQSATIRPIEINRIGNFVGGNGSAAAVYLGANARFESANWRYANNGAAGLYTVEDNTHFWRIAPSWDGTGSDVISFTQALTLDASGNLLLGGTSAGASSAASLAIFNGTAPTGSVTNGIILYAEDVSSSSELKVRDEAGNVTTLSPHNFSLIPEGPSEDMAWAYYSEKGGKRINVDMLKLARMVEKLTGEKLVYES